VVERGGEERSTGNAPGSPSAPGGAGSSDVFVSYASADKNVADSICTSLERGGITCWIAPREFYADAIVGAINTTRVVVLVLTGNAIGSPHVLREIERASAKRHPIVSFRLDAAPLPAGLEYFLSASHWLDATASSVDTALPKLVVAVRRLVAPPSGADPAKPAAELFPRPPETRLSRVMTRSLVGVTAVIAVVVAYLVVDRLWLGKHAASELPILAATPAATPAVSEKSVVVLPFTDLSEEHNQEYFAEGLSEELIDVLGKLPDLVVISHGSAFQFKGKSEDLRGVGAELGVAHVVQGSVRRSGDQVRVTAQLIRTSDGAREWSGIYDRGVGDLLQVQSEIAMSLGRALQLSVPNLQERQSTAMPEAYDLYLRGLHAADKFSRDGFEEASSYFLRSTELDPHFVRAYEHLSATHLLQILFGFVPAVPGFAQVRGEAMQLLRLDPKSSWAHAGLCRYAISYSWDWSEAARQCAAALALAPHDWVVLYEAAELALARGENEKSARLFRAVLVIDPLNADTHMEMSLPLLRLGRLAEAEAELRRGLAITPTFAGAHYSLGIVQMAEGRPEDARREFEFEAPEGGKQAGLAMAYWALGRRADSKTMLQRFAAEHAEDLAFNVAEVYGYLGDANQAFEWLERAYRQKDAQLQYLKGDWPLRSLERDPRYSAFLRKMKLPE
jgi:TolB-like protein